MTETLAAAAALGAAPATTPLSIPGRKAVLPPIAGSLTTPEDTSKYGASATEDLATSATGSTVIQDTNGSAEAPSSVVRKSSDVRRSFKDVGKAIKVSLRMSSGFNTLRDMTADGSLDPACLKPVRKLGEEFMDGGTLKKVVSRQMIDVSRRLYSCADAFRWGLQVAEGLEYLHAARPLVIHRDLKLENILMKGKDLSTADAKIADFAPLAPTLSRTPPTNPVSVPPRRRCRAPEMYRQEAYNEKVDVFSFGVILFEVLNRYQMVCAISIQGTEEEVEGYAAKVSEGYRPPLPERWPHHVKQLIADCWAQDPAARPSMAVVRERIAGLIAAGVAQEMQEQLTPMAPCTCIIS
eukprot:XP_001692725.1 predicted protein [Chlamydomonas reinhardtii]